MAYRRYMNVRGGRPSERSVVKFATNTWSDDHDLSVKSDADK